MCVAQIQALSPHFPSPQPADRERRVCTQGYSTINGTSLTWTAVPEPTTAFAGILLGAGLLRRRREQGEIFKFQASPFTFPLPT